MLIDYEILRLVWWALLGVLLIGFAVMDGFDMGVATLLPFVGKTDTERRIIINTIGPVWEGNQVWLILGGGAIFAAWPYVYAVSFSGFYFAIFIALFAIILRPVGFKFRSKMPHKTWRSVWDICLFIGGAVPPLIFGVAFGNLFLGADFHFDETLRSHYTGGFWQLLSPFALLCGLVSTSMVTMHGGIYLALKTENPISNRAQIVAFYAGILTLILFSLAGLWLAFGIEGYTISTQMLHDASSNPLSKTVTRNLGGWLENYKLYPGAFLIPLVAYLAGLLTLVLSRVQKFGLAFITSALCITGIITTAGASLFPFLLPSATDPDHSLTVWDASSSQLTLFIMLIATVIFVPIILIYTSWVFRVLRGKVTPQSLKDEEINAY
ncbi:MAG: cytochrome d ubiquinol oxidase subunit II [Alphaproteobacteria bacterium]|jgi:cytochrome bd ubiquinol oxidase subunit II|nr:cytochrome d ubiquinol oxidase subunit II [Alphaproteobacteria bacterium]MBT5389956.1 cytochrome d ubiquinol oxidase subunit II [Alphaproteobacteria bacterium]MBT5541146.1 cytochrome d ubiquinol oxidase subunit II [Alphaproteobacteria bacterium]MBT5653939.1 cytochrome d ubiquinol oxidase subunit II [Alphaproteobacteria bacterium]